MEKSTFSPPGETDLWCVDTKELISSPKFQSFLAIYNAHINETRANKVNVTTEDVLNDRNLRNRMRAFFNDDLELKLRGAAHAETVVDIRDMANQAMTILDDRNSKLKSGKLVKDSTEDTRLLTQRFKKRIKTTIYTEQVIYGGR